MISKNPIIIRATTPIITSKWKSESINEKNDATVLSHQSSKTGRINFRNTIIKITESINRMNTDFSLSLDEDLDAIEAHQSCIILSIYNFFPVKDQKRLTTFSGPLKGISQECRGHSVAPSAISNSCSHVTLTANHFDLNAHGQVRHMMQGWEKFLKFTKETFEMKSKKIYGFVEDPIKECPERALIFWNARKERKRSRTYHDFVDLLAIERALENLKNVIPESNILEKYLCATRNMKGKTLRKFGRRSPIRFNEGVSQ